MLSKKKQEVSSDKDIHKGNVCVVSGLLKLIVDMCDKIFVTDNYNNNYNKRLVLCWR